MELIDYQQFDGLLAEPVLTSLLDLHLTIFEGQTREQVVSEMDYYRKRGPLLIDLALAGNRVIGYKMGYERKTDHFYSWLGGVDPAFRGHGIADTLMRRQHDWCARSGYHTVRTQTYNQWRAMLILNLKHGFDIVGTQQGKHGLIIVLEKSLPARL